MNQVQTYYRHSGKTTARGMAFVNVIGVASALILGAIYGYGIRYIPFVYLKVLATLALGGVMGWVIGKVAILGHLRNKWVLLYFGFLFGIGTVYAGWVSWIYASSQHTVLMVYPRDILNLIQRIAVDGAWSIGGTPVNGFFIYLIWVLEALLIIGISAVVAGLAISNRVYCETCNLWINSNQAVYPLEPIPNGENFKLEMERGDYSTIRALKKINPLSQHYTRLVLSQCPGCQMFHLLTVATIKKYTTKRGIVKERELLILKNFIIDVGTYQMLLEMDKPLIPAS